MKSLFLTLCLSLSTLAHADWTVTSYNLRTRILYLMTAENAAMLGSTISLWHQSLDANDYTRIALIQYDCAQRLYITHEILTYDPFGRLIRHEQPPREWSSIAPDMADDIQRRWACTLWEILVQDSQPVQRVKRQRYQDM